MKQLQVQLREVRASAAHTPERVRVSAALLNNDLSRCGWGQGAGKGRLMGACAQADF